MDSQNRARKPLYDFKKINEHIYFYKPKDQQKTALTLSPTSSSVSSVNGSSSRSGPVSHGSLNNGITKRKASRKGKDPSLIIYCAWASAVPRHVTKYTDAYKERFPTSAILLILSPAWVMVLPRTWHAQLLRPAAALIKASITEQERISNKQLLNRVDDDESGVDNGSIPKKNQSIGNGHLKTPAETNDMLLHVVSNGGVMAANALAISLGHPFPIFAVIFDCAPGTTTIHSATNGIFATLPIRWQNFFKRSLIHRFIGRLIWSMLFGVFTVLYTLRLLFRLGNIAEIARVKLNDGTVIPKSAKRCYLYCMEDELVAWKDVESHADDAERKGCGRSNWGTTEIERIRFGPGAKHAALSLFDGEKYWQAVERTWRGNDVDEGRAVAVTATAVESASVDGGDGDVVLKEVEVGS